MIKKRLIATITGLAIAAMVIVPAPASALTSAELQAQINALMAQLAVLQGQLTDMGGTPTVPGGSVTGCTITTFTRNLKVGDTGADVKCLQIILNSDSDTATASGAGSAGQETSYFGTKTKAGVVKFQTKYASEILAVYGLTTGTGYVGSTTRAKLDTMLGGTGTPTTPTTPTDPTTPVVPAGPAGSLMVTLASNTPGTQTVPAVTAAAAYNVPVTRINFTAGSGAVTVSSLKILRSGLGEDAAISNIKIFDEVGNQIGNTQSIGSGHKANFNNISFVIPANTTKTLTVKVSMTKSSSYSGSILAFGIESADDITSNATSTTGGFALTGNSITLTSSVTIGTATLTNGSLGSRNSSNLYVDPTDKDIRFTQVKIAANSYEGLTVKQITAVKNGTVATGDVVNIRLVNDATGETLGTVASLNSDGRAVFTGLNVAIAKGQSVELSIIADMNDSGSGRTVAFDLHDGSAYTIEAIGNSYGFGVTPTVTDGGFCDNDATSAIGTTCQAQTINQGYVTVRKSAATPATGYIAIGANQVELAAFEFTVYGEPINFTSTGIYINPTTATGTQFTNITGYDDNGTTLFGPKDGVDTGAGTPETLTFTDGYTLPVGVTTVHVKANIANDVSDGDKVAISLAANSLVAKGATSGKTTYTTSSGSTVAPASIKTGNTQTVNGPSLSVITAGTPIAGYVVQNARETFAYFDLDTTASGEDVKVTQIIVTDTTSAASEIADITNLELWGDPDTTDGVTEFVRLETSNSTASQTATTGLTTFTFKTPLKIKKGTVARLTLTADVTGSTAASHTHLIANTADHVVSTGWTTGTGITETYSGPGQALTVSSVGTLKIVKAASIPVKTQFVAGGTGETMMAYKLYASYEDITINELKIATEGTSTALTASISKVRLFYEGKEIGNGYPLDAAGNARITLGGEDLVVPKDTWADLTIKVDLNAKASLTDNTDIEIGLAEYASTAATALDASWGDDSADSAASQAYYVIATGAKSGTLIANDESTGWINSTATTAGVISASYQHKLYDGILTVKLNTSSPSGGGSLGSGSEIMRLDLEAVGDDITINKMEFCVYGSATGVTGTGSVTIKSNDLGTTYATITQSGYDAYWDTLLGASTYYPMDPGTEAGCFSIGDAVQTANTVAGKAGKSIEPFTTTLVIEASQPKTIRVLGDTTGAPDSSVQKSLQLKLESNPSATYNSTTSGIEWQNVSGNAVDEIITRSLPVAGNTLTY